jgi:predicted transcriptional regulator
MIMSNGDAAPTVPALTTEIVAAYVGNHALPVSEVALLITTIGRALAGLGREPEPPAKPEPAVPVRRSVQRDHLVCLVCGRRLKSLRRHLETAHDLTPEAYREMFGLKRDYPMVAPAVSARRAEIARQSGLGQRPTPAPEVAMPAPAPALEAAPAPELAPEAPVAPKPAPRRASRAAKPVPAAGAEPAAAAKPKRSRRKAPKTEPTP